MQRSGSSRKKRTKGQYSILMLPFYLFQHVHFRRATRKKSFFFLFGTITIYVIRETYRDIPKRSKHFLNLLTSFGANAYFFFGKHRHFPTQTPAFGHQKPAFWGKNALFRHLRSSRLTWTAKDPVTPQGIFFSFWQLKEEKGIKTKATPHLSGTGHTKQGSL